MSYAAAAAPRRPRRTNTHPVTLVLSCPEVHMSESRPFEFEWRAGETLFSALKRVVSWDPRLDPMPSSSVVLDARGAAMDVYSAHEIVQDQY